MVNFNALLVSYLRIKTAICNAGTSLANRSGFSAFETSVENLDRKKSMKKKLFYGVMLFAAILIVSKALAGGGPPPPPDPDPAPASTNQVSSDPATTNQAPASTNLFN
jgi:hypothetical protein